MAPWRISSILMSDSEADIEPEFANAAVLVYFDE